MRAAVFTADFAQADERGKVNAIGLGWSVVGTPLPTHSVVILFHVDWHETNEKHVFKVELLDEDGETVSLPDAEGALRPVVEVQGEFEQGRPPGLVKGTALVQPFAFNLPAGMPLEAGHRYEYKATIGSVEASAAFSVVKPVG